VQFYVADSAPVKNSALSNGIGSEQAGKITTVGLSLSGSDTSASHCHLPINRF
jgi:hypothetical protein